MARNFPFILPGIALLALLLCVAPAQAQVILTPGGTAPGSAIGFGPKEGSWTPVTKTTPLPVGGKQESFSLAAANAVSAVATVYGGDYIFAQVAGSYGTVKLQILGPDGVTWLDVTSKMASDSNGAGTGIALPNDAIVRVVLIGTTSAYATLRRVP